MKFRQALPRLFLLSAPWFQANSWMTQIASPEIWNLSADLSLDFLGC